MAFFSGLLELLVIHNVLCVLCSSEQDVYHKYETVYVGTNETVELYCYRFDQSECAWRISKKALPSSKDSNATDKTYILYTDGHLLNPKLNNTNIDIIGGNNTGKCNLKIRRFTTVDEGSYTCKFWSRGTDALYHVYIVQLNSLPFNLTIHQVIMKKGKKVVRGIEGKNLTIVCTVKSGRLAATLVLRTNGISTWKERTDCVTYSFIPTKKENMQSIVCSAYSTVLDNPLSFKVQLDIQYSPVVEITRRQTEHKLILICNPSGNPENYTFGNWEHWSEFKEHIQNLEGTPDGTLPLPKSTNNKWFPETDGIYKCKASNGIHGTNGHLYQIGTALVHNKVPPIFVNANKPIQYGRYGQKMNLTALLYNKYGTVQTTISKLSEPLHTETKQETIETQDISHDVNVTVSGIKIAFQLTLDKIEDFTDYTIKACNKMGCNNLTVKITSGNHPEPPTNVSVIPFEKYLAVSWCPGYNGGFPQKFFVEYQAEDDELWSRSEPVIDNMEIRMSENLYDVTPNTQYHVRVLSKNEIGESHTTNVITLWLSNNVYDVTTILLVLLVVIAVALVKAVWIVVLIVLAVGLAISVLTAFLLLRRKANDASGIYNPREEEVRENFQMEPVDNQLYLSSDDPDLAHLHNLRNQRVTNTNLPSTSHDNQTYQMQLHNENGANVRRPCTYINRGVVSSVNNRQICETSLNYTEITFNQAPTMQDAAIHGTCGSVNRTIYSEIDLMADPVAPLSSSESECDESDESDILFMHM